MCWGNGTAIATSFTNTHTHVNTPPSPLPQVLDSLTYEASLAQQWDDVANQKGFDWEMEKLRRYAAGLTVNENGDWVRGKGSWDWTFSPAKKVRIKFRGAKAMRAMVETLSEREPGEP